MTNATLLISTGNLTRESLAGQVAELNPPIAQLARYFKCYQDLASSNIKDQTVLAEQMQITGGWRDSAEGLAALLAGTGRG